MFCWWTPRLARAPQACSWTPACSECFCIDEIIIRLPPARPRKTIENHRHHKNTQGLHIDQSAKTSSSNTACSYKLPMATLLASSWAKFESAKQAKCCTRASSFHEFIAVITSTTPWASCFVLQRLLGGTPGCENDSLTPDQCLPFHVFFYLWLWGFGVPATFLKQKKDRNNRVYSLQSSFSYLIRPGLGMLRLTMVYFRMNLLSVSFCSHAAMSMAPALRMTLVIHGWAGSFG